MNTKTQQQIEDDYIKYLKQRHCTARTIENKLYYIRHFFEWLEREGRALNECDYSDLLVFVKKVRKEGFSIDYQGRYVQSVRQLYASEVAQGRLSQNPIGNLIIKGRVTRIPHNLLTLEQLQKIYDSYTPQTDYQLRNKVMLGLYVNQGLIRMEINRLEVQDIDLNKGTIRIRRNIKLAERILPLAAYQVLALNEYISSVRPRLLQQTEHQKGDRLFFTYANGQTVNESLRKMLQTLKRSNLELKALHQIRSSLLSHWVKEKPIREAQYLAGHNSIVSTQCYKDVNMQDLSASLNEYHPLK
jgi:integrase/recombinase XerD